MSNDVNSKGIGFGGQFAIFAGSTIGGVVLGTLLSVILWFIMTGGSMPANVKDIMQPKYYNVNMVLQGVSTFFIFFLPAYFFALICYSQPLKYLGFKSRFVSKQLLLVVLIIIVTLPLCGGLASFNKWLPIPAKLAAYFTKLENERAAEEAALIQITSLSKYFISLLGIALLPALFEETFFRGGMQKLFTNWFKNPWLAIFVTGLIFSAIHISYYGFLVRFALGAILGIVYYFSGNIWLNILMHFLFNGIQVTALYIYHGKPESSKPDIENGFPIWMALLAAIAIVYLIIKFIKASPPVEKIVTAPAASDFEQWTQNTLN